MSSEILQTAEFNLRAGSGQYHKFNLTFSASGKQVLITFSCVSDAEMYYDWMKQLADGVKSLEGIIPLTPDRIPFIVKYTTEFDETGRPVKAYGSAAPV